MRPKLCPEIELIPASADQQSVVTNLLELYMHDFSEFRHLDLAPSADSATQTWADNGLILTATRC
jgi:hypothetical protein